jgi:DNA modification methylase
MFIGRRNYMIHFLPADEIEVQPGRNRKVFSSQQITALAESISSIGLIHPLIVRVDGSNTILAAGERRLRAMKMLMGEGYVPFRCLGKIVPLNCVPVLYYHELDELTAKQVELDENLHRVDLTWQERAQAISELHKIQQAKNPGATFTDTASVLETEFNHTIGPGKVKEMTLLVENMYRPEVAAARTEKDATRAMFKALEQEFNEKLGLAVGSSTVGFIVGDGPREMQRLAAQGTRFDVVCTDPPYGIDADRSGLHEFGALVHSYKDSWEKVEQLLIRFSSELDTCTKDKCHLYLFCDVIKFAEIAHIIEENTEFKVWPRPLIWVKNKGTLPSADYGPHRMYECILYANKGKRMITGVYSDVLTYPYETDRKHAAQKPVALYKDLLRRSCRPGDKVLDPFCGSGTIFSAACDLQLEAVGVDSDPAMGQVVKERLK